jgi:hypothetical protein
MMAEELERRKGKQDDGSAKTREVKLGCVFSQTKTDEKGQPMRDYQSTSYVGTVESVEAFAPLLRDEARRRGIGRAQKTGFIGHGAAWNWELARTHFPLAILILDFYQLMEYLHELSHLLYGKDTPWASRMKDEWKQVPHDCLPVVANPSHTRRSNCAQTMLVILFPQHQIEAHLDVRRTPENQRSST